MDHNSEREINPDFSRWPIEMTKLDILKESGITGNGVHIAVVDSNISPPKDTSAFMGKVLPGHVAHGFLISKFIQNHLPDARVTLIDSSDEEKHVAALRKVAHGGFDVMNLSISSIPHRFEKEAKGRFKEMVDIAVRGKQGDFEEAQNKYLAAARNIRLSSIIPEEIRAIVARNTTIVAASGYPTNNVLDTFSIFPDVILIGGFDRAMIPRGTSIGGRVEYYAPGDQVPIPFMNRYYTMNGHSIAAPFYTIAASVVKAIKGNNTSTDTMRKIFDESTRDLYGLNVLDFEMLLENLS